MERPREGAHRELDSALHRRDQPHDNLNQGHGGIDNFIEAGKALRGEPHAPHKGYVFANAWVHQTVEAMCLALMVDPKGDPEIIAAQNKMKATLDDWIPKILSAQEPDGYLQTALDACAARTRWPSAGRRSSRGNHEGYTAGYFIESAINHYTLTERQGQTPLRRGEKTGRLLGRQSWSRQKGMVRRPRGNGTGARALRPFRERHGRRRPRRQLHRACGISARLPRHSGGDEYDQSQLPVDAAIRSRRPRRARGVFLFRHGGHRGGNRTTRIITARCCRCGTIW